MNEEKFRVTAWNVDGDVDYDRLLEIFGAERLNDDLLKMFPEEKHVMLRRGLFYAHRDLESFLESYRKGERISVVSGRGVSGKMHLGHLIPFYFTKWLQEKMGAFVFIPFSDDEKYLTKKKSMKEIKSFVKDNVVHTLAVGFDEEKTRIVVDTEDGDVIYPLAVLFSKNINYSEVKAIFGEEFRNVGWIFYPSVQTAHIFFPQVLFGKHETLVAIAIDQDPYIRLSRDIAKIKKYDLKKPVTILSKFLPNLESPFGKMSTSNPDKVIWLDDDYKTIRRKLFKYAFSGGQPSLELHRKYGGNPDIDVSFLFLKYFFEEDDAKLEEIEENYRKGKLTTGELKDYLAKKISSFLEQYNENVKKIEDNYEKLVKKYRLKEKERNKVLDYVFSKE